MEQELNQFNSYESNYFKVEFENQNIELVPEFKKWHEKANKYINEENAKRGNAKEIGDNSLLLISFCKNCKCYSICSFRTQFSFVKCSNCKFYFCAGCSREMQSNDDESLCLKGYFRLLFIRIKYRRVGRLASSNLLNIIYSILCILFTPAYFAFVSNTIGLQMHQNSNGNYNPYSLYYFEVIFYYSILRGILMIPYVLLFLPFTIILLIPSLFIPKYFFKLNSFYTSILDPCDTRLDIDN